MLGPRRSATLEATQTTFEPGRLSLGPLAFDAVDIDSVPIPSLGSIVGNVGNGIFSLCAAAVFDVAARTLWLEPPCRPHATKSHADWKLKHVTKAGRVHWRVQSVIAGGSAARAGVRVGDEVLRVAGKLISRDPTGLGDLRNKPAGANVALVVLREGREVPIPMMLRETSGADGATHPGEPSKTSEGPVQRP